MPTPKAWVGLSERLAPFAYPDAEGVMSRWIDRLPESELAELRDAGRIGMTRFDGPATQEEAVSRAGSASHRLHIRPVGRLDDRSGGVMNTPAGLFDLPDPDIERPVYLHWSEDKSRSPVIHGWGGSDIYKCEVCPEWQGDGIEQGERHSRLHRVGGATVENLRSMFRAEAPWLLKDSGKIRRVIFRVLDEAER